MQKHTKRRTMHDKRPHVAPTAEPAIALVQTAPARPPEAEQRTTDDGEMLTYVGLARMTGIRRGTLYSMVCRGEIPHFRLAPRILRFRASEIAEWMASRHQAARAPEVE